MKIKIDCYEVSMHRKTYKILKFPAMSNCVAFLDWAEEVYMIDFTPDAAPFVRAALAGLIVDSIIIFFPIRHKEECGGSTAYDTILCRSKMTGTARHTTENISYGGL